MGRTNLIILCMGLVACVALSLMMRHAAQLKAKHDVHPLVAQIDEAFGDRLRNSSRLQLEMRGDKRHATLEIGPTSTIGTARLAHSIWLHAFRYADPQTAIDSMDVVATYEEGGEPRRFSFQRSAARAKPARKRPVSRPMNAAPHK